MKSSRRNPYPPKYKRTVETSQENSDAKELHKKLRRKVLEEAQIYQIQMDDENFSSKLTFKEKERKKKKLESS